VLKSECASLDQYQGVENNKSLRIKKKSKHKKRVQFIVDVSLSKALNPELLPVAIRCVNVTGF